MTQQPANRTISILYRYSQRFFAQELRSAGFSLEVGWLPALMQAYRCPGVTQDGISAQAGMDKGTVARAVKQLEEAGLIFRAADEADRRINHIHPTAKAMELYPSVVDVIGRLHGVLYAGLSEEEVCQALSLLERMKANLAAHLETRMTDTDGSGM